MKNVVECKKEFFAYFNALLTRGGWWLTLGLKEGLVECATVCIKSEVILKYATRQPAKLTVHDSQVKFQDP